MFKLVTDKRFMIFFLVLCLIISFVAHLKEKKILCRSSVVGLTTTDSMQLKAGILGTDSLPRSSANQFPLDTLTW